MFYPAALCAPKCLTYTHQRLSGVFEVRIYPVEYSIPNIMAACKASPSSDYAPPYSASGSRVVEGIDLAKLDQVLSGIDYAAVRRRRAVYTRLLNEATGILNEQGRGISFTGMLMLLAHHKLIVDREALEYVFFKSAIIHAALMSIISLKDLVARTETNKLVTDLVNLDRVKSLLSTISCRRRFLAHLEQKRMAMFESQGILYLF